jgi:tripartite-type tricarboxylate transporter receptor subunit TctC
MLGGHVDAMWVMLAPAVPHLRSGKLKALAVASPTREPNLPDVPTAEEGGVADFKVGNWQGLFAPAGTPKPIVDRLNAEIQKVLAQPEVKADFAKQGAVPMQMSADEFGRFMAQDIEKWAKVVKASGAKVD